MTLILINYDFTTEKTKSHIETLKAIEKNEPVVQTGSLAFFSHKYNPLFNENGHRCILRTKSGKEIVVEKALGENEYTRRMLNEGHHLEKLLMSGEFDSYLFN